MEISQYDFLAGSTGYTILDNDEKKILLFADIHDGVQYCKSTSVINIEDFLNIKSRTHQIILEEAIDDNLNLTPLWNARHTVELKKLLEKNNRIIPTDIRPYLILFSWQLAKSNKKYKECKIENYLYLINEFLGKKGKIYNKFIFPQFEFIKNKYKNELVNLFNLIQKNYENICYEYTGKTIGYILEKDINYLHSIDDINSYIMEYYIILLILSDKRNSIIHTGLAHSSRLKVILSEYFNFKIIQEHKMTDIEKYTGSDNTNACIMNPRNPKNSRGFFT